MTSPEGPGFTALRDKSPLDYDGKQMLDFFRKYQKIFFIFVTAMVILSFTFLGTFSTFTQKEEKLPKRLIGKTIDGKAVTDCDVRAVCELMQTSTTSEGRSLFDELIIKSTLGQLVTAALFEEIKEDFAQRIQKIKKFSPYVHPQVPFLSAKEVWKRFAPEIDVALTAIQTAPEEVTPEQIGRMLTLYAAQQRFSPGLLKQILHFQQMQLSGIEPDPLLGASELPIAGFQTLEDWFGSTLLERVAITLLNGGSYAKKKGITVSNKEARENLYQIVAKQLAAYQRQKRISRQEVERVLCYQLKTFGIEEVRAIELWQSILSFQRDLEETLASVFIDRLTFDQPARAKRQEAKVCLYQLPPALRFRDLRTMLKFERYLEAVAGGSQLEQLPQELLAADLVSKRFPQLVKRQVEVEFTEVNKTEVAGRISLKQTWDFELEESNYPALIRDFPILGTKPFHTKEERFSALRDLDDQTRLKVDQAARFLILAEHPEWIEEELQKAHQQPKVLSLHLKGGTVPFKGAKGGESVLPLLQEGKGLEKVSFDGEHFYAIRLMRLPEEKEVLTFEEANSDGTLDELLDTLLETAYSSISRRNELRAADGSIPSFEKAKDRLGAMLYKDRLESIRDYLDVKVLSDEEVAAHRFDAYLEQERHRYIVGLSSSAASQWNLVSSQENWIQGQKLFACTEGLESGAWATCSTGGFFQLIERIPGSASQEEIHQAQQVLAEEARILFLRKLLSTNAFPKPI